MSTLVKVVISLVTVLMVGCTTTSTEYYEAMRQAAEAQAYVQEQKFKALSQLAQSSDSGAASAAVMAIALTQEQPIVPQFIESDALKWAQVMVPSMTTLGGLWFQTDLAKTQSNNSKDIQLASFESQKEIQLGTQATYVGLAEQWAGAGQANSQYLLDMGLAGFDALNIAGGQTQDVAIAGFESLEEVSVTGFTQIGTTAVAGFTQLGTVAMDGFDALNTMSTNYNTTILGINDDWAAELRILLANPLTNTTTTTTNTTTNNSSNIQCNIVNNAVVCSEID
ncbi:MAG: hypothetical protein CL756_04285 [Chloroflexi bacterium]|nr:hypothetical protein [Chloroflexota bacterium]MBB37962.1 hypothetical protein [Actinomycetota bacterium]